MSSFPASAVSNPDIQPARNGGENRIGAQARIAAVAAPDQRERNKTVERQRRKSTNQLFDALHSLLPYPIPKTDRVSILGEAISYIPVLRAKLEDLKTAKDVLLRTKRDDIDCYLKVNVGINVEENRVDVTVSRLNQWPPLAEILNELERQGLELINCSSFVGDTKYVHQFNTKCLDASLLSPESLQNTLQKIGSTPSPNV